MRMCSNNNSWGEGDRGPCVARLSMVQLLVLILGERTEEVPSSINMLNWKSCNTMKRGDQLINTYLTHTESYFTLTCYLAV